MTRNLPLSLMMLFLHASNYLSFGSSILLGIDAMKSGLIMFVAGRTPFSLMERETP